MLKIIYIIVIGAAAVWFLLTLSLMRNKLKSAVSGHIRNIRNGAAKLRNPRSLKPGEAAEILRTVFYCLTFLCVAVLAVTGFVPYFSGDPLSGFNLLLHVSVAPLFAVSITILILLLAYRYIPDTIPPGHAEESGNDAGDAAVSRLRFAHRISFWLLVLLTPFVMGSIVLSMYTVFGTEGQVILLLVHRISAILFFVFGIIYMYYLVDSSPDNIVMVEATVIEEDANHEENKNGSQESN